MSEKIISPTDRYREDANDWNDVRPSIRIKALLLQIDFIKQYGQSKIDTVNGWKWQLGYIPGFDLALSVKKADEKGNGLIFLKELLKLRAIDSKDMPDGISETSVRRLAGLAIHWMLNRDGESGNFTYGDDYFDRAYKEEWKKDDDNDLEKIRESISKTVKMKGVSDEDLY